jgi:diguanylate cyclase (GGDEF)-like protein/PAS domain S-box-containing protein
MMDANSLRGFFRAFLSLRGKLLLSFVGLTLAVGLITLSFAWLGGRQSGEKLASQTAAQVTARIAEHVSQYTREAELIAGSVVASVDAGSVVITNPVSLERYLWQASKVSELASYTYVGTEAGLFVGVERENGAARAHTRIRLPEDAQLRSFETERVGDRARPVPEQTVLYDPRLRGWYKQAKAAGIPIFTEPYMSASKKIPVVTYAVPLLNANGEFLGAIAVDFTLAKMAAYLQKLPPSESGVMVLKSAKGITLATSGLNNAAEPDEAAALIAKLEALTADNPKSVWVEKGTVLSVLPVKGAIQGTVAVAIPAQDIWADARVSWWRALLLSGILTLLAIAVGVGWLNSVVRDLSALRRATKEFESGATISALPVGRKDEIGSLARAFASMSSRVTSELRSSRSLVEVSHVARKNAEASHLIALARSRDEKRRLAAVVDAAQDCIAIVGVDSIISYANPAFAVELRMPADALIGATLDDLLVDRRAETSDAIRRMHEATQRGEVVRETVVMRRADDTHVHLELTLTPVASATPGVFELAVIGRNVTDYVERSEELTREAKIDPLTQLLRRAPMLEALQARVRNDGDRPFSILFLDLDGFKLINDRYGHSEGDKVLAALGTTLRQHVREGDLAARFGGDEFVIAIRDDVSETTARAVADRLIDAISEIARTKYHDVSLSASIGISSFPADSRSLVSLVRYADQAMYAAKRGGGARWQSWRDVMKSPEPARDSDVVVSIDRRRRNFP